jgi:hypothetical protein
LKLIRLIVLTTFMLIAVVDMVIQLSVDFFESYVM